MMFRAGASNRDMTRGLGIDIRLVYRAVFASGVALAALTGMIAAPAASVYPGMGGGVLSMCFVVVVIGGIGSISGALVAALLVGFADTFGKVFFAQLAGKAPATAYRCRDRRPRLGTRKFSMSAVRGDRSWTIRPKGLIWGQYSQMDLCDDPGLLPRGVLSRIDARFSTHRRSTGGRPVMGSRGAGRLQCVLKIGIFWN